MRCKIGDLAVIINCDWNLDNGTIVKVTGRADIENQVIGSDWEIVCDYKRLMTSDGFAEIGEATDVADSDLLPIRDQPGQDETLTWLDVPSKELV